MNWAFRPIAISDVTYQILSRDSRCENVRIGLSVVEFVLRYAMRPSLDLIEGVASSII